MTALWTEACLTFPALDAIREGFEVYIVVDAVSGTSKVAHAAIVRRTQASVKPISWVQLLCELQRDWNRTETVPTFSKVLFAVEGYSAKTIDMSENDSGFIEMSRLEGFSDGVFGVAMTLLGFDLHVPEIQGTGTRLERHF